MKINKDCNECHGKGFVEEICPDCKGNINTFEGCGTCQNRGVMEYPCYKCEEMENNNENN